MPRTLKVRAWWHRVMKDASLGRRVGGLFWRVLWRTVFLMGVASRAESGSSEPRMRPHLWVNLTPGPQGGLTPDQVRRAYGFNQLDATGAGQTIALVVAYGSPSLQSDLNTFSTQFGLPAGQLRIVGKSALRDASWALEASLDVQWIHAVAPDARIIVSVARSAGLSDMMSAVRSAVSAGARIVSMSWGSDEFADEVSYESVLKNSQVTFVASSGDSGAGSSWPACSPSVLAVGGTRLELDSSGSRIRETAWSGSGGGPSAFFARPLYQKFWIPGIARRATPDVSIVGDPETGVAVCNGGSWYVLGGTSAGAPMWAGIVALANQTTQSFGALNGTLYGVAPASRAVPASPNDGLFYDVQLGSNGAYFGRTGFDLVTGIGSPKVQGLVPRLSR